MLRLAASLALLLLPLLGCQPSKPPVSEQGRQVCRQEAAAQAGTVSAVARLFQQCLETIDRRLQTQKATQLREEQEKAAAAPPPPVPVSPAGRYFFCTANREAIREANDRLTFALGPWMAASATRIPDDPIYQETRARYEEAYAAFEKAIPPEMRGDLPLVPDAATLFRNCRREDFFP
jgi:hypothetical protein